MRDELANNLAMLSSVDNQTSEVEKTWPESIETDGNGRQRIQGEIWSRIGKLESVLSDSELERLSRLEALSRVIPAAPS